MVVVCVGDVVSLGDAGAGVLNRAAPEALGEFSRDRLRFLGLVGLRNLLVSATRGSSVAVVRALGVVGRRVGWSDAASELSEVRVVVLVVSAMKMDLYWMMCDDRRGVKQRLAGPQRDSIQCGCTRKLQSYMGLAVSLSVTACKL